MANTLIINSGSKTIKFAVFDSGLKALLTATIDNVNDVFYLRIKNIGQSSQYGHDVLLPSNQTPAARIAQEVESFAVSKIGFRIVHGGAKFIQPTLLDAQVLNKLAEISNLAPLHNPPTLKLINEFKMLFPQLPLYGVFDTAFHSTLTPEHYLYGLPYEYYTKYGIRKYGFHGISNKYVSSIFDELEPQADKIVSCHLGSGSSVTAIVAKQSFDTSMGFTPMEGLMMTTRPGDVDDGAIDYLQKVTGMSDAKILAVENQESGLLGISGISFDMRILLQEEAKGNARAHLAIEMYIYRVIKYIGSYIAIMGGIDGLIFTGGIGAGSDVIRKRICANLKFAGLEIDDLFNKNKINVEEDLKISKNDCKPIWIIPTQEEFQIAKEISELTLNDMPSSL